MSLEPATYLTLSKPRITAMVVLTALTSFGFAHSIGFVAERSRSDGWWLLVTLSLGTALLSAGASAMNMWWEKELDARMTRTQLRPLPAGRIAPAVVLVFGVVLAVAGAAVLAMWVNLLTALLGVLTLVTYVFFYTPLKTRTHWSTHVGALPGALPVLMGYAAARGVIEAPGVALFGVLLLWQLPHFFAINWLYREEYEKAGFRMLASVDPTGRRVAVESVLFTILLIVVSVAPPLLRHTAALYLASAVALGAAFLVCVVHFARTRNPVSARRAMLASIVYLPVLFVALLVDRFVLG